MGRGLSSGQWALLVGGGHGSRGAGQAGTLAWGQQEAWRSKAGGDHMTPAVELTKELSRGTHA